VLVVDANERSFNFGESLVEDVLKDAVLLVGEERREGIEGGIEEAVDGADELGKIGVAHGVASVGDKSIPGVGILRGVTLDGCGEVLVSEVEDGEADVFALLGDARAERGSTDGEAATAGGHDVVGVTVDIEAEDVAGVGITPEDRADGVMGADAFEVEAAGVDEAAIDIGAGAKVGIVAPGAGEDLKEIGFERCGGSPHLRIEIQDTWTRGNRKKLVGELDDATSVGDDLYGLDAGDVVEEPTAGGVHELGVALELEEFERGDAFRGGEGACGVRGEEAIEVVGGAVEDDVDEGVSGGPEILEERLGDGFGERCGSISKEIEGFAKRGAPALIPAGVASVASAVGTPAFDAMGAGPRGIIDDFGFPGGRKFFEKLAVVREACEVIVLDVVEGVAKRHLAVFMVMAVGFSVGGDVGELRFGGRPVDVEAGDKAAGEGFAIVEEAFEGDGSGGGPVVEEDGDGATAFEADEVGAGRVDGGVGRFDPGTGIFADYGDATNSGDLVGSEDSELDALLGEEVEDGA